MSIDSLAINYNQKYWDKDNGEFMAIWYFDGISYSPSTGVTICHFLLGCRSEGKECFQHL